MSSARAVAPQDPSVQSINWGDDWEDLQRKLQGIVQENILTEAEAMHRQQEEEKLIKAFAAFGETGDHMKLDDGKPRLDLIPSIPLMELAKLYAYGARKYSDHRWREGMDWSRIIASLFRHLVKYNGGEDIDPDTGLSHATAIAWNAFALIEYEATHRERDDRYKINEEACP